MADKFEVWAILEIFGHQRIAGKVTEQVIAGQGFIRVDVPELPADPARLDTPVSAHTKLFGPGAIYAINPVDEQVATAAAIEIRHVPVTAYGMEDVLRNASAESRQRLLGVNHD